MRVSEEFTGTSQVVKQDRNVGFSAVYHLSSLVAKIKFSLSLVT